MRCDVYKHKESGKLLFVAEQGVFPDDFNKAYWQLLVLGTLAPPHVLRAFVAGGPYHVTTTGAIEKA